MKRICGIDEAGRGALLGPLVVAGVCIEESKLGILTLLGVKDSKLLAHSGRERIFNEFIEQDIAFFYSHLSPQEIDATSINTLEIRESAKIITALAPHQVFLDVPARGRGIGYYCQRVAQRSTPGIDIVGGNKFDRTYPVVAAASIVAKVMRERAVNFLQETYGNFGSGYPTKRTILYVEKHYDKIKPIVRMKWKTAQQFYVSGTIGKKLN